jgi:hypothetical protein
VTRDTSAASVIAVQSAKPLASGDGQEATMMNHLVQALSKTGLLRKDLDYHLIRTSMVIVFLLFGYQKWFGYEAQVLIPFISNGPLISWLYPAFGISGASWFLGMMEWLFGLLLLWGFWKEKSRNSWCFRIMRHICGYRHDYPVHAERLGCGRRRLSSDDR